MGNRKSFWKEFKHKYLSNDLVRNSSVLASFTIFSQLISIGSSPILTRFYGPLEYAELAIFMQISGLLSTFFSGRYEYAIPLPKETSSAIRIFQGMLLSFLFGFMLFFPIWFLGGDSIIRLFGDNTTTIKIFYLIAPFFFFSGFNRSFFFLLSKFDRYKHQSINRVINRSLYSIMAISFGFIGINGGLIYATVLSAFIGLLILILSERTSLNKVLTSFEVTTALEKLNLYRRYPLYDMPRYFYFLFTTFLISIILSQFYSKELFGQFSFSQKILNLPLVFITQALTQVFLKNLSDRFHRNENLIPLFKKSLIIFFLIGIIPAFLIGYISYHYFGIIFSEKWHSAGIVVCLLIPWYYMEYLATPIQQFTQITGKLKEVFFLESLGNTAVVLVCYALAKQNFDFSQTILIISCLNSLIIGIKIVFNYFWLKNMTSKKSI